MFPAVPRLGRFSAAAAAVLVPAVLVLAAAGRADTPGQAASPAARGQAIAEEKCGRCHATGPEGRSPHPPAPPFRDLPARYPVESLAEALAEGIVTGHKDMPVFILEPAEIDALLTYIASLAPPR